MQTLQLQIDDSIFDKLMGFIDKLPKEKISIINSSEYISFEEAQKKVQKSLNGILDNKGIGIDEAFDKILDL
jgi:hypothetical protein